MPQTLLVTGGAGFIGSHLVELLVSQGARITVVDDFSTGRRDNLAAVSGRIELRKLDLTTQPLDDLLAARPYDAIFHLAANGYVPPSVENPRLDFDKNALGTLNLLEAVRRAAPQTPIIYTSTAAVYGTGRPEPLRETDPTFPLAPYGVSKLAAERYVAVYATLYGLRTASARLFPVYGPRLRKQVIYDLIQKLLDNPEELFIYGDGSQVRDLNHVHNVAHALLLIARRARLQGEVYNLSGAEPLSIRELAQRICAAMQLSPRFLFSGDVRPGDAQHWTADLSRLKALGYTPHLRLEDGLADMVRWCRAEREAA